MAGDDRDEDEDVNEDACEAEDSYDSMLLQTPGLDPNSGYYPEAENSISSGKGVASGSGYAEGTAEGCCVSESGNGGSSMQCGGADDGTGGAEAFSVDLDGWGAAGGVNSGSVHRQHRGLGKGSADGSGSAGAAGRDHWPQDGY